jgi:predicted Zn finger-like uncharacterized protein
MRVSCPACAAEYEIPSARLQPRRKVKCARCDAVWTPVREVETTSDDTEIMPPLDNPHDGAPGDDAPGDAFSGPLGTGAATAMDRLAAAAAPRSSIGLRAAWVASVLLLVTSAAATVTWRGRIVQAWPASALILGDAGPHAGTETQAALHRTAAASAQSGSHSE